MAKDEKKERKKSGKAGASRAKSPTVEDLTPEGRVKKVMELTSCSESVAEMVLLSNIDLDAAVLAVLDLQKEDDNSWKEGGKVHKPKKQNDAFKGKLPAQGNRRGDLQGNRVRSNPNEVRQVNPRVSRESQGTRQLSIAGAPSNGRPNTGRNVAPRQSEKLEDRKPRSAGPPPVDLDSKEGEPDWRNGPLVFEKTVPPSPVSVLPKSDKPTFAEIAANKKTLPIALDEPKLLPACVDQFGQVDGHCGFSVFGGQNKQSSIHSPSIDCGSAPVLDLVVNEEFTKKLKTDIGFQSDHIGEFAVAARVKSLKEDGEFFTADESEAKHDQFCSLEEVAAEEPMEKSQKPMLLSYVNAAMLTSPTKKPVYHKEVSKIDKQIEAVPKSADKQTEVVSKAAVQNPSVQQQPMVQNMPLEFQHLSPAYQQLVIALAAQLSNSVPFNQMQPMPPVQSMQISGNPLEAGLMLGRMMPGQQILQGQPMVSQQPRMDRPQPAGGMFGWQQQSMSSQPAQQVRMHAPMEVPPGFPQAYGSEYQAMIKFQADQQVPSSFENQRVVHGGSLPQMQQPSGLVNPPQRSLASHGFPQNYGYGIAANGGGSSQQMPMNAMSGSYGGPFMQNYQQR